jgi:hypothetical protein
VTSYEQQVIDREGQTQAAIDAPGHDRAGSQLASAMGGERLTVLDERAARATLRAQIARLERERCAIVAERFPHVRAPVATSRAVRKGGPTLLDLGELELVRDALAADMQQLRARVSERLERERRAREQLAQMRLDPGRYKFARLPVRDLGQGVCGVWEVRPRLGLIGMLAGWWQLKLSSGCPLAKGSRSKRDPGSKR